MAQTGLIEEYLDALVTMQLSVAFEKLSASIEKRTPKPNQALKACIHKLSERLVYRDIRLLTLGIRKQPQAVAGLTQVVREYKLAHQKGFFNESE